MEYRAIVKRKSDDELQHWKYIKRVKGKNGKWQYYYDTANTDLQKYNSGTTIVNKNPDGSTNKTSYKQTKDWLDSKEVNNVDHFTLSDSGVTVQVGKGDITYKQGKLSRAAAKGEKWIFDNLISNDKKAPSQRKKKKKIKPPVYITEYGSEDNTHTNVTWNWKRKK